MQYSEDGRYDLVVDPYADLDDGGTWYDADKVPVDLTGYTALARFRSSVDSSTVLLECSTANGKIVLGGAAGWFAFNVPASEMQAVQSGWVYDLYLTAPGGKKTRLIWGDVIVKRKSVTRG